MTSVVRLGKGDCVGKKMLGRNKEKGKREKSKWEKQKRFYIKSEKRREE